MKKALELVFIPSPGRGHQVSMVEFAKLLVARDDRFLITVLITKFSFDTELGAYTDSLAASSASDRIKLVDLTRDGIGIYETNPLVFMDLFSEYYKPHFKKTATELAHISSTTSPDSPRLVGFVVDMLMTTMIDVANELKVPTYVFFPSSAGDLGLMLHDKRQKEGSSTDELVIPSFFNPVPISVLPGGVFNEASLAVGVKIARRIRQTKGVIINTFTELETHAIHSFPRVSESPLVYPVGPIIHADDDCSQFLSAGQYSDIIAWLDDQPPSSVVFLCFGSMGSFGGDQVKEIARGLEQSGVHFLWCLRQPPPEYTLGSPDTDPGEALPEGFLDRTAGRGKVISSWAPQAAVLSHQAVGGFVSHCGWNSILESLWFGVPVATWPLEWEQQLNAFQMAKDNSFNFSMEELQSRRRLDCRDRGKDLSFDMNVIEEKENNIDEARLDDYKI
ncbi:UDP-glucuronosyl/UDP-glucosyltransferase [Trema orientale]|uniref:Glycosyltransferase n=1 Tax=Trema orientale TaxID=63057 RepID=A0A2P5FKD9_TREOI|nr:UDP-glucuronosyl/UDP-glucosyltransferase [Trema orientale]